MLVFFISACGEKTDNSVKDLTSESEKSEENTSVESKKDAEQEISEAGGTEKTLVIYFSATGMIKGVAIL